MANIFHVERAANKITLGTTGTTINVASHTASRLLALDASKDLTTKAIGVDIQAFGNVLDDLNTLGANAADSEFLVGTGTGALAWESGITARTSIGLGNVENTALSTWAGSSNITILGTIATVGNITIANDGTIGQAAGPLLTFDDTNNYLEITGCKVGIGIATPTRKVTIIENDVDAIFIRNTDGADASTLGLGTNTTIGYAYIQSRSDSAGTDLPLAFWSHNNERMRIQQDGGILMNALKSGVNQAGAGAAANELWIDTADNSIKIGV